MGIAGRISTPSRARRSRNAHRARRCSHAWYLPLYRYGVIHGDPHLGNYQVRADQGLNLLDFGAIRVFPAKFVIRGVIDAVSTPIRDNDDDRGARRLMPKPGDSRGPARARQMLVLNEWARFIHEPLLQDRVRKHLRGR